MACFEGYKFGFCSVPPFFKGFCVRRKKKYVFFDFRQYPRLAAPKTVKNHYFPLIWLKQPIYL